jgi:hypothetical protein
MYKDMHFVHRGAPSVRARHFSVEDGHGTTRFIAELTAIEHGVERAMVDAGSSEELDRLVQVASRAFALAVRLRRPA